MARIAVEDTLGSVKQALQQEGHEVVAMDASTASNCQCCVISGQDQNVMGMADIATQAPVINAHGLSTSDIVQQVNQQCNANTK